MRKEYIIVGDNNFWYASCMRSLKEAKEKVKEIKNKHHNFGNPFSGEEPDKANKVYIYKAEEISVVKI